MQSLHGKTALVTGASTGIGRVTALALAREGVRVAITARSADKLMTLAREIGPDTVVIPADLSKPQEVDGVIDAAINRLVHLDVLFANAGIYIAGDAAEGDPDEWDKLLMLNVHAVFRSINRVLPHMRKNGGGDILVTSSISAHQVIPFEPVYGASKHAVNAFLHALRQQVAGQNIRVGSIAPGTVLNELWGYTDPAEVDRKVATSEGLRSEDVSEAALFMLTRPRHVVIRDLVILPQALQL